MDNIEKNKDTSSSRLDEIFSESEMLQKKRDRKFLKKLGRVSKEISSSQKVFEKELSNYKILPKNGEIKNKEKIILKVGGHTIAKKELTPYATRENEDSAYINPEKGIIAVFDGVGGANETGASELASSSLEMSVKDKTPKNLADLESITYDMNRTILKAFHGESQTTATIGRIIDDGHTKKLIYASVGDSRIYLVRDGEATQITQDEGEQNIIYNVLGSKRFRMKQSGEVELRDQDQLLFCTDGITGDFIDEFLPNQEIAKIMDNNPDPEEAAKELCNKAIKVDDRTAVVAKITF